MGYKVKLQNFEGPFELLLYLVSQKKVDVGQISIAEIADQFKDELAHMQRLDLAIASNFLLVAATLLKLKADVLSPKEATEDEQDEEIAELSPDEVREVLIDRLIVYKKFKNAANDLAKKLRFNARLHPRMAGPDKRYLQLTPDYLEGIELETVAMKAAKVIARREQFLLDAEHIASKPLCVENFTEKIIKRLRLGIKLMFSQLLEGNNSPELVVVNFLAILELYKRGQVQICQEVSQEEILIEAANEEGF
ncbi:MAG: segregation/condensation protein A [Eggerthellaceae bacterium]|nr:segregation/condensation protein A [Eggerthellaceae bacterium]